MSAAADPVAVEAAARSFLGTPFVHRASLAGAGCDCVGLARGVWRAVVGPEPDLPAYPEGGPGDRQALIRGLARHMIALPGPGAGTLVVLRMSDRAGPMHCGVLTARASLIHALPRAGVVEAPWGPAFARRLAAAFAFPSASGRQTGGGGHGTAAARAIGAAAGGDDRRSGGRPAVGVPDTAATHGVARGAG